jgi:beta-phosphoglucomutase-like phosphatase (HAD superfamily)
MINEVQACEISKLKKKKLLDYTETMFVPNFELFLNKIIQYTNKIIVVTNSDRKFVNHLKKTMKVFDTLEIITREDYIYPKPSSDGYVKALDKLNYNKNDIIIGIENSLLGLKAVSRLTNIVFACCYDYSIMNQNDGVYYFNDYSQIINILNL